MDGKPERNLNKELSSRLYLAPQLKRPTALQTGPTPLPNPGSHGQSHPSHHHPPHILGSSTGTNAPLTPNFPSRGFGPRLPSPVHTHGTQHASPLPLSLPPSNALTPNHNLVPLASPALQPTKREVTAVASKKVPPLARNAKVSSFVQPGPRLSSSVASPPATAQSSGRYFASPPRTAASRIGRPDSGQESDHRHTHDELVDAGSAAQGDRPISVPAQNMTRLRTASPPPPSQKAPVRQSPEQARPETEKALRRRPKSAQIRAQVQADEKKPVDPFEFIASVRKVKDSVDFVYMVAQDSETLSINPYNLKIVSHSDINKSNFYTASSAGITHFVDGTAGE